MNDPSITSNESIHDDQTSCKFYELIFKLKTQPSMTTNIMLLSTHNVERTVGGTLVLGGIFYHTCSAIDDVVIQAAPSTSTASALMTSNRLPQLLLVLPDLLGER